MEEKNHIQWGIYDVDNNDYYISLDKETLNKIKEWKIIKSKIVYDAHKHIDAEYKDIKKLTQKKLFITLLSDEESRKEQSKTKLINSEEKVILKISNSLLDILTEENRGDYQHRYDMVWNKIHFLIDDTEGLNNEKERFDNNFRNCEELNRKEPVPWDIFESEYINVYQPL